MLKLSAVTDSIFYANSGSTYSFAGLKMSNNTADISDFAT